MTHPTHNARGRIGRLVVAAALVLSAAVAIPASASPTEDRLDDARTRYEQLNQELSRLVEEYNAARVELDRTEDALAQAKAEQAEASAQAEAAGELLEGRVTGAYMDSSSELEVLLEAGDFGDLSDRIEFLDQLQQQDADLAARAENASQRAAWAQEELDGLIAKQRELLERQEQKQGEIENAIKSQRDMIADLEDQLARERQLAREAAQAAAEEELGGGGGGGQTAPDPSGGGNPPINGSGAAAAIAAAKSVIGTQYNWGGASPSSGFDCSGLTMWSWAHGGVSLPHSSSAQYAATPRVDRGSLQPGDLLFFYSPISHVSMYLGGNSMIDASHPGPGGQVKIGSVYWGSYVGAGRPG